mgnify:CR=1 FL=1
MAKIVYLCSRQGARLPFSRTDMESVLSRLTPDNIIPRPPRIIEKEGFLVGVFNPTDSLLVQDLAVCMGVLLNDAGDWWRAGSQAPDGSYALFRNDAQSVELLTDIVGTRTLWYVQTPDWFIASTSQRAIVCFLGDFEPNAEASSWMLSSGTLGPGLSWDRRIRCLGGNARLILNRDTWTLTVKQETVRYDSVSLTEPEHAQQLLQALTQTFLKMDLDMQRWMLPLSGGVDSRAVLLMLKDRVGLRTITWGQKGAQQNPKSDAYIAQLMAAHVGVAHEYYPIDISPEPFETVLQRFLIAGEGRVDHVSAYVDGLAIWKRLFENGCQGAIRGDEAFGCMAVRSHFDVYRNMGLTIMDDYKNSDMVKEYSRESGQHRPESLEQRSGESLEAWRDRLNTEFEAPYIFAALNDLKLPYVEMCSPLLSRRVIRVVRQLPDFLRTNKTLFRKIVNTMAPGIRYASHSAIANRKDILKDKKVVGVVTRYLESARTLSVLPQELIAHILAALRSESASSLMQRSAREKIRVVVERLERSKTKLRMDIHVLAFRAYLISRMTEILAQDSEALLGHKRA